MQPVNDDMDNLFRRAADGYPLKSDGADFDKVRQQLDAEKSLPEKKESRRKYLWLMLLLLIPIAFLLGKYYTKYTEGTIQNNEQYAGAKQDYLKPADKTIKENTIDDTVNKEATILNKKNKTVTNTTKNSETYSSKEKEITKQQPKKLASLNYTNNTVAKHLLTNDKSQSKNSQANSNSTDVLNKQNELNEQGNEAILQSSPNKKEKIKANNSLVKEDKQDIKQNKTADTANTGETNIDRTITQNLPATDSAKKITEVSAIAAAKQKQTINSVNKVVSKKVADKNKIQNKSAVYIGVVAGLDASTVKSNKSSGTGYDIGFVAGYNTGRHLAFETGVLWNYKKYYSDGKHVVTEKLGLLQHTTILYLDGTCSIIEIPVNISYHFNAKGNHNWYAGTGLSSYIMKKENYDYLSTRYGTQYYGEKEYSNSTANWLSVLQFNIGYQVKLNKGLGLRIEPYAKLPLKGLGIGKLPISSAGINIGFTLPVH